MTEKEPQPQGEIVISGLDDPQAAPESGNITPTDKAIQRQQEQKPRGEPEDEDG